MNYKLIKDLIQLSEDFQGYRKSYTDDLQGFKQWIADGLVTVPGSEEEPGWEGKQNGRSPESVITTQLVHLNRYAKSYSRSAIHGSDFSTQDEFIYLINLKAFGAMTKMELIKKNIHDKSAGIQIINRLLHQKWVEQRSSESDKRSRIVQITVEGMKALEAQMQRIRKAMHLVTGDLSYAEKMQLIKLMGKLENFHQPVFLKNLDVSVLLDSAGKDNVTIKN